MTTEQRVVVNDSSLVSAYQGIDLVGSPQCALVLTLIGNKHYMYLVPRQVYVEFVKAKSKGAFYNSHIKKNLSKKIDVLTQENITQALALLGVLNMVRRREDGRYDFGIEGLGTRFAKLQQNGSPLFNF